MIPFQWLVYFSFSLAILYLFYKFNLLFVCTNTFSILSSSGILSTPFYPPSFFNLDARPGETPSQKSRRTRKQREWNTPSQCKEIVVYGQVLHSGIFQSKVLPAYVKYMYGIVASLVNEIYGILLGDGWLFVEGNGEARLGLKQCVGNFAFLWVSYLKLSHYCHSLPYHTFARLNGKIFDHVTFQTRNLPVLTLLYNKFYVNGVKIVPEDIREHLDAPAFANWIMGDGTFLWDSAREKPIGLALCTDSFSDDSRLLLISALWDNFGIESKTMAHSNDGKVYYRILIPHTQMAKVTKLVKPFMHSDFYYRIGIGKKKNRKIIDK